MQVSQYSVKIEFSKVIFKNNEQIESDLTSDG